ncbi:MAG: fibronectin type III domain-containing protein [Saprospiraceae bacterium]|nr:fibronectin type III domain-containing protein [Saprospiraceae bacterium]
MRNIFLFIILTHFSPLFAHSLPNNVISDCNLPAPTNLQAVEVGPSYAIIAWDAVPGAAGYLVSWYNASGAQINADTTLDTEFEVQGLEPGETYDFRVAAVCVSGEPSAIYAPIIVVPIITELVISTDNPLGNLVETCSQPINPVAECVFDFNLSKSFVGKVKLSDLNQVYYFRVRYSDHEFNGENSKVLLDMIKPHFYTETPVPNPKLFTEYGDSLGLIHAYGSARKQKKEFLQIIITKIKNTSYKISLFNMININSNMEFSFYSPNIFELSNGTEPEGPMLNSDQTEKKKSDVLKHISVFNLTGKLVAEFETEYNEANNYLIFNELTSGIYIIRIRHDQTVVSKKIMVGTDK